MAKDWSLQWSFSLFTGEDFDYRDPKILIKGRCGIMNYIEEIKKEFPEIMPGMQNDLEWAHQALDFLRKGNIAKAETIYKKLCLSQPQHHEGFAGLAHVYYFTGEKDKSQWFMKEAIKRAKEFLADGSIDPSIIEDLESIYDRIINDQRVHEWEKGRKLLIADKTERKKIAQLFVEIEYNTDKIFPREQLHKIKNLKEEAIPVLLEALKMVRNDPEKYINGYYIGHIYALFLLAEFRVKEAFPVFIDIFKLPTEILHPLLVDTLTESGGRLLASVSENNIGPIMDLIEDEEADEYSREQGLLALKILALQGVVPRREVLEYFGELLDGGLADNDQQVLSSTISASLNLYPEEIYEIIQSVYEKGLILSGYVNLREVDNTLARDQEEVLGASRESFYNQFIDDTVKEMEDWACFKKRVEKKYNRHENLNSSQTVVKKNKVGRNDPCPCGSGKKYKKCCLRR